MIKEKTAKQKAIETVLATSIILLCFFADVIWDLVVKLFV